MEKLKEIIKYAKKDPKVLSDIMKKFNISESQKMTLRRRLKDNKVIMKEARGRKKIVF